MNPDDFKLDEIADRFEAELRQRGSISIAEYLRQVEDRLRPALLRMLLPIELELRKSAGQSELQQDYYQIAEEFGDEFAAMIQECLHEKSRASNSRSFDVAGASPIDRKSDADKSIQTADREPLRTGAVDTAGSVSGLDTTGEFQVEPASQLDAGMTFGRYEILEKLGGGGMGDVYKARDTILHRIIALKIPRLAFKSRTDHDEVIHRFYREARAMATLNHPNLCQVFDVGSVEQTNFLSMAFVDGTPLSVLLDRQATMQADLALGLCRKIALGLDQAHRNQLIHRDLKPANIVLTAEGEPVVIDFGLARNSQTENAELQTIQGKIVGTPAYMSPEQVRGETDALTPATDIFSLGVVLFRMLTGSLPFPGPGLAVLSQILSDESPLPSRLNPALSPLIDRLIGTMLAKNPSDRFPSMREVARAIESQIELPADRAIVRRSERKTISTRSRYDLFIAYAPADDYRESGAGWVSTFIQDLEWRLCQLHGSTNEISVVFAADPVHESQSASPRFLESRLLLVLRSSAYAGSIGVMSETKNLRDAIAKKTTSDELLIAELEPQNAGMDREPKSSTSGTATVRFWSESNENKSKLLRPDSENAATYFSKLDDLARQIISRLKSPEIPAKGQGVTASENASESERDRELSVAVASPKVNDPASLRIYLAEVTDDLEPIREEVRRYLEQLNVEILPRTWYARDRELFVQAVNADLAESAIFVQLIGPVVGKRPPDGAESYSQLQYQSALKAGKPIWQWRSTAIKRVEISDGQYAEFLFGPQVQAVAIQEFKRELAVQVERLRAPKPSAKPAITNSSFVFLNVDSKDSPAVRQLCELLDQSGCCYALPLREGRPDEIGEDLEANLVDCDALIIYYGEVSEKWVREQLRMWRRILHRREKPVLALAILEGPPDEKPAIGMHLPQMELLNCRDGINRDAVAAFLRRLG